MIGKFLTYLVIGYIQLIAVMYVTGDLLFNVPMRGSMTAFLIVSFPFLMCNLMLGLAASTIASSQLQASQLVSFFFLPSLLLSGFLFPFYGMPYWAQVIGDLLPLTHYMRITSGIMLKDFGWADILPELWPILIFAIIVTTFSIVSFKRTLD
jgi:ABC-2 type transport system permease protein